MLLQLSHCATNSQVFATSGNPVSDLAFHQRKARRLSLFFHFLTGLCCKCQHICEPQPSPAWPTPTCAAWSILVCLPAFLYRSATFHLASPFTYHIYCCATWHCSLLLRRDKPKSARLCCGASDVHVCSMPCRSRPPSMLQVKHVSARPVCLLHQRYRLDCPGESQSHLANTVISTGLSCCSDQCSSTCSNAQTSAGSVFAEA